MGYGVYRSNFNGTGATINVSGALFPEDDAFFFDHLGDILRSAADDLGMAVDDDARERAGFDPEFRSVARNDALGIGVRCWQHDYVVGIGSDLQWAGGNAEAYREEILRSYHLPVKAVVDAYMTMSLAAADYVRLRLQQIGFNCRYPTTSYTSATYSMPDDVDAALAEARAQFKAANELLSVRDDGSAQRAVPDTAARQALLEDLIKMQQENRRSWDRQDMRPIAMLYDPDAESIIVVQPMDNDAEVLREIVLEGGKVKRHLDAIAAGADGECVPLRFDDPVVRPWLDAWLASTPNPHWEAAEILVDVDDVRAATKGSHEVCLRYQDCAPTP